MAIIHLLKAPRWAEEALQVMILRVYEVGLSHAVEGHGRSHGRRRQ